MLNNSNPNRKRNNGTRNSNVNNVKNERVSMNIPKNNGTPQPGDKVYIIKELQKLYYDPSKVNKTVYEVKSISPDGSYIITTPGWFGSKKTLKKENISKKIGYKYNNNNVEIGAEYESSSNSLVPLYRKERMSNKKGKVISYKTMSTNTASRTRYTNLPSSSFTKKKTTNKQK
jgi:hypothetical protein